jgi:hypothetical protein
MSTETRETPAQDQPEVENDAVDVNSFFDFNKDQDEEDLEDDMKDFDGFDFKPEAEGSESEEEEEEEEEEDDSLFPEEEGEESEEEDEEEVDFTDEDLAEFNKKLNKNFDSVEELKKFLGESDKKETEEKTVDELETAQNTMDYLTPLLDRAQTSDEDLLRREYETIAINEGKDITDEDVRYEIDEKIETLRDTHQIDLRANTLRAELSRIYSESQQTKTRIEAEKAAQEAQLKQTEKEQMMNAFADISKRDSFFGIKPEKEVIREAYKKVNSGEFLKRLQSDKNTLAKLAMIDAYEKEIHKKASSGLTYSDGLKATYDEFKGVKDKSSGLGITKAQKTGTAASDKGKGLISSLTS